MIPKSPVVQDAGVPCREVVHQTHMAKMTGRGRGIGRVIALMLFGFTVCSWGQKPTLDSVTKEVKEVKKASEQQTEELKKAGEQQTEELKRAGAQQAAATASQAAELRKASAQQAEDLRKAGAQQAAAAAQQALELRRANAQQAAAIASQAAALMRQSEANQAAVLARQAKAERRAADQAEAIKAVVSGALDQSKQQDDYKAIKAALADSIAEKTRIADEAKKAHEELMHLMRQGLETLTVGVIIFFSGRLWAWWTKKGRSQADTKARQDNQAELLAAIKDGAEELREYTHTFVHGVNGLVTAFQCDLLENKPQSPILAVLDKYIEEREAISHELARKRRLGLQSSHPPEPASADQLS